MIMYVDQNFNFKIVIDRLIKNIENVSLFSTKFKNKNRTNGVTIFSHLKMYGENVTFD